MHDHDDDRAQPAMDEESAREALVTADSASAGMRSRARLAGVALVLLAIVQAVLIVVHGIVAVGSPVGNTLLLLPVFALLLYSATRPVSLRHRRGVFAVLTVSAGVLVTVVSVFGTVFFADSAWWWWTGAFVAASPIAVAGVLDIRAGRARACP